jgi:hypothetical protein
MGSSFGLLMTRTRGHRQIHPVATRILLL